MDMSFLEKRRDGVIRSLIEYLGEGAENLFKDGSVSPRHVMLNISIQSVNCPGHFFVSTTI